MTVNIGDRDAMEAMAVDGVLMTNDLIVDAPATEVPGIDPTDAVQILPSGVERTDRMRWLTARRIGIGGSDVSGVLGMSRWTASADVWEDKTARLPLTTRSASEAAEWGLLLEPVIREEYARRIEVEIVKPGMLQSQRWPWMVCNVDGLVVGRRDGYEGKCADARTKEWSGAELADHAELQAQHCMAVTGYERWHVVCLVGGNRPVIHVVDRDDDLIATVVATEERFWRDYVQADVCPPVDGSEAYLDWLERRYPTDAGGSVEVTAELAAALRAEHRQLREERKALESRETDLTSRVKALLGASSSLISPDREVATWRRSRRFCEAAFRKEHPELATKYTVQRQVDVIDTEALEAAQPELYREFCSRPLIWKS